MTRNKSGDLFNTSLTEIIIIIFFVLMLFALFNIRIITEKKEDAEKVTRGVEVKVNILRQRIEDLTQRGQTTGFLDEDYEILLIEKDEEILALKDQINDLLPIEESYLEDEKEESKEGVDGEKVIDTGNCNALFWRECASKAWPISSEIDYDYLLDIGVCPSGDIVAIRSEWKNKNEADFLLVNGAKKITDKMYIQGDEIEEYISLIHNKALDFLPEQTMHVLRVIAFERMYEDVWEEIQDILEQESKPVDFPRGTTLHSKISKRFPENACDTFKKSMIDNTNDDRKDILDNPIEKEIDTVIEEIDDISMLEKLPLSAKIPNEILVENGFKITCNRSFRKRTPAFNVKVQMTINVNGKIKDIRTEYVRKASNYFVVADLVSELRRTKTESLGSEYDTSNTYFFNENVCK